MESKTNDMISNSPPNSTNLNTTTSRQTLAQKERARRKEFGFCGCWSWFKADPWTHKQFMYWLIAAFATLIIMIVFFTSEDAGYIVGGIFAMLVCGYGGYHFSTLLALKEQVDKYSELNLQFKQTSQEINSEVDKLSKAKTELSGVESGLKESNLALETSLQKFKQLDKNLQSLGGSNLEGMKFVQDKSAKMLNEWKQSLIQQEKDLISEVFDRFEMKDDKEDMTKEEFNLFLGALPEKYRKRQKTLGLEFDKLCDENSVLTLDNFQKMLDIWVEKGIELRFD